MPASASLRATPRISFLRVEHFGQPDRALFFHLVLDGRSGARRHAAEDAFLELLLGALERDDQDAGFERPHEEAEILVVHLDEIVEDEELVLDVLRDLLVDLGDRLDDLLVGAREHVVHDLGGLACAAARRGRRRRRTGDFAHQDAFEILERLGADRIERRDAVDDVGLLRRRQQLQRVGRDRRLEIGQDQSGDLRMFVGDQAGDGLRVHPAQFVERDAAGGGGDPREHAFGAVGAQRVLHHRADARGRAEADRGAALGAVEEHVEHFVDLLFADVADAEHRGAELLYFGRVEPAEQVRRFAVTQHHQQDRGGLGARSHLARRGRRGRGLRRGRGGHGQVCVSHSSLLLRRDRRATDRGRPGRRGPDPDGRNCGPGSRAPRNCARIRSCSK